MRLDQTVSGKLGITRSKAQQLIECGRVSVNGKTETKNSFDVSEKDVITLTRSGEEFVSRAGVKLDSALKTFGIDVSGYICADIGASKGGFTDCLLKRGAGRVYAVDVGHSQLDESLLSDDRVVSMEKTNARYLKRSSFPELCNIAVSDVSFISLTYITESLTEILEPCGVFVGLIKPQFEAGRENIPKTGIVKDRKIHIKSIIKIINSLLEYGFSVRGLMKSPIEGGDGNTEFLVYAVYDKKRTNIVTDELIKSTVNS